MMQVAEHHTKHAEIAPVGRWVTEAAYAQMHGLSRQTLANWRYRDRLAGRTEAAPGYPIYRRFGRAVRYQVTD